MKELILNTTNELSTTKLNYEDLIEKFIKYLDVSENTLITYKRSLKQFVLYLKDNNIVNPTRDDILNFKEYLVNNNKPNTVNLYLASVKSFFNWIEYEGISKDITKNIKAIKLEKRHLKRGLSEEEIQKVLKECKDTRETLIIKLMLTCALRINEVANIELKDFYNDRGVIMLRVLGKARDGLKQDSVKIDDRLFELIQQYCNETNVKDYLFTSTSNHNKGGKVTTKTLRLIINNILKKAGVKDEMTSSHSLRHSSCELLLENGMPVQEVSEFMRHRSILTTTIYSKEIDRRKNNFANVLSNVVFD